MSKQIGYKIVTLIACVLFSAISYPTTVTPLLERTEVNEYIDKVASEHQYDKATLRELFTDVKLRQDILNAIAHPAEAKPWYFYRNFFVNDQQRIEGGLTFWDKHANILQQAEAKYGVPAQYIVAILGIETLYGKHQGKYRVLDSLATLAFNHERAPFFRKELTAFLLLVRENKLDPKTMMGSYAGAMGQAQFMPSNIRLFGVNADGTGQIDLINHPDDAILSIANYLQKNGWHAGEPVAFKTTVSGKEYQKFVAPSRRYRPKLTQNELKAFHVKPVKEMPMTSKAILIELQHDKRHKEFWLGFQNFYAITRYNPSANYAMAVFQLGNTLNEMRQAQKK